MVCFAKRPSISLQYLSCTFFMQSCYNLSNLFTTVSKLAQTTFIYDQFVHTKGSFTLVKILQWTVAFPQRDRKLSISALMLSIAESADHCCKCEWALRVKTSSTFVPVSPSSPRSYGTFRRSNSKPKLHSRRDKVKLKQFPSS